MRNSKKDVRVKVYDGAAAYRRDVNKMARAGYKVQSTTEQKKRWTLLGGYNNKSIITVTYVRAGA